uniref:CRISPR-associated helicase Cas3' n=1 Tax=Nocardioides sp. TaxID=35761 RepID=UPI0026064F96
VWGKSSGFDGDDWLPLVQHLIDSADVADFVWEWLPLHTRHQIDSDLPKDAQDGRALLRWLAASHDCGKTSPSFASKVPTLADHMHVHGLVLPQARSDFAKAPHGLVGHVIMVRWLRERYGASPTSARSYAVVVGGHHGVPPTSSQIEFVTDRPHLVGMGTWVDVQNEILDGMATYAGATAYLPVWANHRISPTTQALLTGAVIVCDWLASNTDLFPFGDADSRRAAEAWDLLQLPAAWRPDRATATAAELLPLRFPGVGTTPRPMQDLAVDAARTTSQAPLIIIESAMGSGKSEAALMAAEVLASRFNCGGLFVGLPTMATSDGMFRRVLTWVDHLDSGPTSIHLAHGKAGLNDGYAGLTRIDHLTPVYDDDLSDDRATALVHSWLTGRKKGVLATMVVGTIDQLLFMALQSKHVALRHLAFAGKVVIVDEVHAADDFMRTFLRRALEWLAAYGVPVILLSATLPSSQRAELVNAYRAGLGLAPTSIVPSTAYPLVTVVDGDFVTESTTTAAADVTRLKVTHMSDDPDALVAQVTTWAADGGCVAVICNTVTRAQTAAQTLREHFGADVELHHSRFIAAHRATREEHLRHELGPDGERPRRRIVVGTQVLEQSLDVDFDAIITDIAPVDLVLQRAGRLHRHQRERPSGLTEPHLAIRGITEWTAEGPDFEKGSRAVYGESRLLRSVGALGLTEDATTSISLPGDIRPLVETAYRVDPSVAAAWRGRAQKADALHGEEVAASVDRAGHFRLDSIEDLEGDLINLLEDSRKDAEDARGTARVRDSEDGIEVIVVQTVDGVVRFVDDGTPSGGTALPVDAGAVPENRLARALSAYTVRLPLTMTLAPTDFDKVLTALENEGHDGWQQSPWLAGQLVLHLDEEWRASVAGFDLTYSMTDGLTVAREETPA